MEIISVVKKRGCNCCGGKMVFIRGKYPKQKRRKICPTCAFERLEQIADISSPHYGITVQSNTPNSR